MGPTNLAKSPPDFPQTLLAKNQDKFTDTLLQARRENDWMSCFHEHCWLSVIQRRRDDNKNKICGFFWGVVVWGREENCPKMLFFLGNATTIKF